MKRRRSRAAVCRSLLQRAHVTEKGEKGGLKKNHGVSLQAEHPRLKFQVANNPARTSHPNFPFSLRNRCLLTSTLQQDPSPEPTNSSGCFTASLQWIRCRVYGRAKQRARAQDRALCPYHPLARLPALAACLPALPWRSYVSAISGVWNISSFTSHKRQHDGTETADARHRLPRRRSYHRSREEATASWPARPTRTVRVRSGVRPLCVKRRPFAPGYLAWPHGRLYFGPKVLSSGWCPGFAASRVPRPEGPTPHDDPRHGGFGSRRLETRGWFAGARNCLVGCICGGSATWQPSPDMMTGRPAERPEPPREQDNGESRNDRVREGQISREQYGPSPSVGAADTMSLRRHPSP